MLKKLICIITALAVCLCVYVPAYASGFSVSSVSPSGGNILCTLGEITLTFTDAVDTSTLSGISFTKSDGTEIKGGAYAVPTDSLNKVCVKFGRLDVGDYTLSITDALKSASGESAAVGEYNYSVATSLDKALAATNLDSTSLDIGETTIGELEGAGTNMTYGKNRDGALPYTYTLKTADSGAKYVEYACTNDAATSGSGSVHLKLSTPVKTGTLVLDTAIKADDNVNSSRELFKLWATGDKKIYTMTLNKMGNNTLGPGGQGNYTSHDNFNTTVKNKIKTDSDGFWNLRLVLSRDSERDNWSYMVYDVTTNLTDAFYSLSISASELPDITKIQLLDMWQAASEGGARTATFCFKETRITMPETPKLIYTNGDGICPEASEMFFVPNEDLQSAAVTDATAVLTDADGRAIESDVTYDADNRKIIIKPSEYLKYSAEYKLAFNNGICGGIGFTTGKPDMNVKTVSYSADKKLAVELENINGAQKNAVVIVGVCDASGKVSSFEQAKTSDTDPMKAEIDFSEKTLPAGGSFKLYVWEQDGDVLKPVCDVMTKSY